MNKKHPGIGDCLIAVLVFPFLILVWIGVLILLGNAYFRARLMELEKVDDSDKDKE
jgi:hypothetical protein